MGIEHPNSESAGAKVLGDSPQHVHIVTEFVVEDLDHRLESMSVRLKQKCEEAKETDEWVSKDASAAGAPQETRARLLSFVVATDLVDAQSVQFVNDNVHPMVPRPIHKSPYGAWTVNDAEGIVGIGDQ